jgi:outer membrane protein assembly factor BamB
MWRYNAKHAADYSPVAGSLMSNGQLKWNFTASSCATPTVANGVVYVGAGDLYAINASSGTEIWTASLLGMVGAPAVANGVVYAGSTDTHVYALNVAAKELLTIRRRRWAVIHPFMDMTR